MPLWFEQDFDKSAVRQFFDECYMFTEEFIINFGREMSPSWPLTNVLSKSIFDFKPRGAIIHSTETPSVWNALHMCTRHVYGTHFLVLSGPKPRNQRNYELLSQLPATILMLYPPDAIVPHSGCMSTVTWGIDLRHAGKLRPVPKGFDPLPLMPSEETDQNFKLSPKKFYNAYWRQRLWCYPFPGKPMRCEDYYYENPSKEQLISLIALLRVLDNYIDGIDTRYIVPANCVNGDKELTFPMLIWKQIRKAVVERDEVKPTFEWIKYLAKSEKCKFEQDDIEDEDESLVGEQLERMRWRGERDDGQLHYLTKEHKFMVSVGMYRRTLEYFGYDTSDMDFALHMWAISKGLYEARDEEVFNCINRESPFFK